MHSRTQHPGSSGGQKRDSANGWIHEQKKSINPYHDWEGLVQHQDGA